MTTRSDVDLLPLPLGPRDPEIVAAAKGAGVKVPPYRAFYIKVLNGEMPARQIGSRWYLDRRDMPAILRSLGLVAAARVRSPKAQAESRVASAEHATAAA